MRLNELPGWDFAHLGLEGRGVAIQLAVDFAVDGHDGIQRRKDTDQEALKEKQRSI